MKKVRVYELAKTKNISNQKAIELLKKKGISKASAITYVDPHVIDDVFQADRSAATKVSHLFKSARAVSPPRQASALAASVAPPQAKAVSNPVNRPTEKTKNAAKKKTVPKVEKKDRNFIPAFALAIGLAALVVSGFLYLKTQAESVLLKQVSIDLKSLQGSVDKVNTTVTANRAQMFDMQQDVNGVTKRLDKIKRQALVSQMNLQGAILRTLSGNLGEPLRGKTLSLARHLSAF